MMRGFAVTVLVLLGCGDIEARAAETIRLTNGEWQPFLSKVAPHHGFASFSDDATALGGTTRDISSGYVSRLSCSAS